MLRDVLAASYCVVTRYQPFRHRTGLLAIGQPDRDAPVFVSGNYFHTVVKLRRYLRGLDCYLLVADSAGINVWCAAGAGDFTEHKIADAVNTYHLRDRVEHRELILPQLSAVGVDRDGLLKECGFSTNWGPADYRHIKDYVRNEFQCTRAMRRVGLSPADRMRQAIGVVSTYLFFGLIVYGLACLALGTHAGWAILTVPLLLAGLTVAAVLSDKMLFKWPTTNILLLGLVTSGTVATLGATGVLSARAAGVHVGAAVIITLLLCLDALGSTVDYKTTIRHWLRTFNMRCLFQPQITDACVGCGQCVSVCPKNVCVMQAGVATIDHDQECCECLACVKQCAGGAIRNSNPGPLKGDIRTIPDIGRIMQ